MAENDDWTLLKYNPVDYVMDGYKILRTANIESCRRDGPERFKEEVLKLKGLVPTEQEMIPIPDLATILNYLTDRYGVFELETEKEDTCYLGRLISIDNKELIIDSLNPEGHWTGALDFRLHEIKVIQYDTDYNYSLKLYSERTKKKKSSSSS